MNRREFIGATAVGTVAGLTHRPNLSAQSTVTVAIHFIGLHVRVHEAFTSGGQTVHVHSIATLKGGGHSTVMLVKSGNIASGGLGYVDPMKTVQKWLLTGPFDCPKADQELAPSMPGPLVKCPTKAAHWTDIRYLFNVTTEGAKMKPGWSLNSVVDALFQLNQADPTGKYIGETFAEPPVKRKNREAIWKVCGKKQVLTDRFVYRVTTDTPVIKGLVSSVTLKLDTGETEVPIYVVTLLPHDPCAHDPSKCPPKYPKGFKLEHVAIANGLIEGASPEPKCDSWCTDPEDSDVQAAADLPKWLTDNVVTGRSTIDTFCPGWDAS